MILRLKTKQTTDFQKKILLARQASFSQIKENCCFHFSQTWKRCLSKSPIQLRFVCLWVSLIVSALKVLIQHSLTFPLLFVVIFFRVNSHMIMMSFIQPGCLILIFCA